MRALRPTWFPSAAKFATLLALTLGSAAAAAHHADAEQPDAALYMAVPIVTGNDSRFRAGGVTQAFREVMVKLTGEPRLAADLRIKKMSEQAKNLVESFGYVDKMVAYFHHDDQGTFDRPHDLTVHFDPGKIDATLAELGEIRWENRPVIVPVIAVRGPTKSYLLNPEVPAGAAMRGSFVRDGIKFGVRVRIPRATELADWGVALDRPLPAVPSTETEARVHGNLEFKDAAPIGWSANWKMRWDGADYAWGVKGVSFDTAFDSLVGGVARVASGHGAPD